MWYVIQTSTGREEKIKQECEQRISKDVLSHCVLPLYEEKIKYKGQWHIQKKKLFPGYLFLISENLDELHEQLKRVEAMTKLLGAGDDIIALTQNEIDFLLRFAGDEELVKMSQGMIIGDKVVILYDKNKKDDMFVLPSMQIMRLFISHFVLGSFFIMSAILGLSFVF